MVDSVEYAVGKRPRFSKKRSVVAGALVSLVSFVGLSSAIAVSPWELYRLNRDSNAFYGNPQSLLDRTFKKANILPLYEPLACAGGLSVVLGVGTSYLMRRQMSSRNKERES